MRVLPQGDVVISWPIRVIVVFIVATPFLVYGVGFLTLLLAQELVPFSWAFLIALGVAIMAFTAMVVFFPYRFEFTKERITVRRLIAKDSHLDVSNYTSIQIHSRHKMTLHFGDRAFQIDLRLFGRRERSEILDYIIEMHEGPKPTPTTSTG